jgi:hypothetical protein
LTIFLIVQKFNLPSKGEPKFLTLKRLLMLDQLLNLITNQGQQHVVQNTEVPNEYNNQVMAEAGSSIFNGLQGLLANGGLTQLLQLFNSGRQSAGGGSNTLALLNSPIVQNIVQSFIGRLTNQYNMSPAAAQNVGNALIPNVLSGLIQRVNDPNDSSVDFNSVMQSLTGGQLNTTNFGDVYNRIGQNSLDRDGDGDVDLQDIIGSVSSAAQTQQAGSGGIMDLISGYLGR